MKLPEEFLAKMKALLGEAEYSELINSYKEPRYYGLRINTLKISVDEFLKISPFKLEKIPWVKDGFYYNGEDNPGKHPYYHAGLYYIQEPSAMLPGEAIAPQPGEKVLDLCAAPGGKTVQMAAAMKGEGILVANDINYDRVKALVKNIELCGIRNAVVTNETPENLSKCFQGYFDRILIDAPCSGEGMFRKDPDAIKSWGKYKCDTCSGIQKEIIEYADIMLKPGGYLLYSTCTFSPEENEKIIDNFIKKYMDYKIIEIQKIDGMESGRPQWASDNNELLKTVRMWPHRIKGEGHFAALLKKESGNNKELINQCAVSQCINQWGSAVNIENCLYNNGCSEIKMDLKAGINSKKKDLNEKISKQRTKKDTDKDYKEIIDAYRAFEKENLNIELKGSFKAVGKNLYLTNEEISSLDGIKIAKFGWYLGEVQNNKFEPSHSFVMALKKQDIKNVINLESTSDDLIRYLKGETLIREGVKGYTAICVDGYTIGWAKQINGILKNLYPKGWRKMN